MQQFRLAVLINPMAGLGGSVALKGSDGMAQKALSLGAEPMATIRMQQALTQLQPLAARLCIVTGSGALGAHLAQEMGFETQVIHQSQTPSSADDTRSFIQAINQLPDAERVDLVLFAGGDGTARDICAELDEMIPVLGVPAGVKIHSGVYAVTPVAAGQVVKMLLSRELVSLMTADVMDIDEEAFRRGEVRARRYGEMTVPAAPAYVQVVKMGGREVDELVLADIAAEVVSQMEDELYIMGSGSTVAAVMAELGLDNTLLGVDLVQHHSLVGCDMTATELLAATAGQTVKLVITLIGGQGHVFGRGNQQLSAELIRRIGRENILIVATKTKLKALGGRPLISDSGDPALDQALSGYYRIITGYRDYVMYQVANPDMVSSQNDACTAE